MKRTFSSFVSIILILLTFSSCGYKSNIIFVNNKNNIQDINYDLTDFEQALSYWIIKVNDNDKYGECFAEGHQILDKHKKNDEIIVYLQIDEGYFCFENGIFTLGSGSSIPSKLTFVLNESNEYILKKYEIPQDGSEYANSLKSMFTYKALKKSNYVDKEKINKQMELYASKYLQSIDRQAKIQTDFVEKKLPEITNVELSNKLLEEFSDFPYWIGSKEIIINGKRVVYTHQWQADNNGGGIATFIKQYYDGEIIDKYVVTVNNKDYTVNKIN